MSDLTVYAEALIATAARAFYDDEAVCMIDVLIKDKYLRDDDMAPRLQLPAKKLRATLQFLHEEHLVFSETVDDLAQGGSQTTKFYYLDYNRAVHSIRLRLHLLQKRLVADELQARSSSFYQCPGYSKKRCNGRYTEEEAQQVVDVATGLFLCQQCNSNFALDPGAPPKQEYTLKLMDNEKDLKEAMDNLRRLNVQLSAKFIGNQQLRAGIYDLLQKVRGTKAGGIQKGPITSNLPSENFALGIGSTRLAGTGRTAGIKASKMQKQGLAESAAQARNYLVGSRAHGSGNGGANLGDDLMFLKSAHGHEIQFTVERGGGARAQVLATARRLRRRKLMDAAASRVGASLPLNLRLAETLHNKRKARDEEQQQQQDDGKNGTKKTKTTKTWAPLDFLNDNIGRSAHEKTMAEEHTGNHDANGNEEDDNGTTENGGGSEPELVFDDETEEMRQLSEENRIAAFQAQYKVEMDRQVNLLHLTEEVSLPSPTREEEERDIVWEDGELD